MNSLEEMTLSRLDSSSCTSLKVSYLGKAFQQKLKKKSTNKLKLKKQQLRLRTSLRHFPKSSNIYLITHANFNLKRDQITKNSYKCSRKPLKERDSNLITHTIGYYGDRHWSNVCYLLTQGRRIKLNQHMNLQKKK